MTELMEPTTAPPAEAAAPPRPVPKLPAASAGAHDNGALPAMPPEEGSGPVPCEVHAEVEAETHVLTVNDFKLSYGKRQALHGINMKIAGGKVTALIGPSGCGKSTLLRSMNRLNDLVDGVKIEGDMRFKGFSIYDRNVDVIDLRKKLGMVFQKSNPFPMSIFENVVYSLRIAGEKRRSRLEEVCERSLRGAALWDEVKDRLHQSAFGMSGGQQQRLCIPLAIAAAP